MSDTDLAAAWVFAFGVGVYSGFVFALLLDAYQTKKATEALLEKYKLKLRKRSCDGSERNSQR